MTKEAALPPLLLATIPAAPPPELASLEPARVVNRCSALGTVYPDRPARGLLPAPSVRCSAAARRLLTSRRQGRLVLRECHASHQPDTPGAPRLHADRPW